MEKKLTIKEWIKLVIKMYEKLKKKGFQFKNEEILISFYQNCNISHINIPLVKLQDLRLLLFPDTNCIIVNIILDDHVIIFLYKNSHSDLTLDEIIKQTEESFFVKEKNRTFEICEIYNKHGHYVFVSSGKQYLLDI